MNYILTVKRGGFEDREKPYTYAKAAFDGFDRAVQLHARLASEITLSEVYTLTGNEVQAGDVHFSEVVRAWDRVNGITVPVPETAEVISTDPVVLYDFTIEGLDRSEVDDVSTLFPSMIGYDGGREGDDELLNIHYIIELVDQATVEEENSRTVAAELFEESGLKDEKRPYAVVLPNDHPKGGEVSAILVQLIKQHTGRYPVVLTGHDETAYTGQWVLLDLNKSL